MGPHKALLIVVTYNSSAMLMDLAESINQFLRHTDNYAVVVENSSDPRTVVALSTAVRSNRILLRLSEINSGFSHGVNFGYESARAEWGEFDYIVLLNPDVVQAGLVVSELVKRAVQQNTPEVGVWSILLRDEDGNLDRGCARRIWNRRRFFSHITGYDNLCRILLTAPKALTVREADSDQSELAMVSGALMCLSAAVFQHGLDTLLPMYLEDQEICMRAQAKGYALRLFTDLELVHIGGISRKSVTDHERALRTMELIEAPIQCMHKFQHYRLTPLRAIVLLGGIVRLTATPPAFTAKLAADRANFPRHVEWLRTQLRLSAWFISWAAKGKIHREQISLKEYFAEYD